MISNYQTIVLSGGGSKGPYGLGILLAIEKWHRERRKNISSIYCGTSVGALNSTLAAQGDLNKLTALYSTVRTKDILGVDSPNVNRWALTCISNRKPFYYFSNSALKATIERYANFEALAEAHLLICATNYRTGDLETFYTSTLVDEFINQEKLIPEDRRRLTNYHRITSQEQLVKALLASTAIPFYFPPIEIENSYYVDGGVGNNTPLRQAAYVNRFLKQKGQINVEPTFCIINDPNRFTIDQSRATDIFGVIRRTMDIFNNKLVTDDCVSWDRVNNDVARAEANEGLLSSAIANMGSAHPEAVAALREHIRGALHGTNASVPKVHLPLMIVRPNTPLVDNILEFDPLRAEVSRRHGIADCLTLLEHKNLITSNDRTRWENEIE